MISRLSRARLAPQAALPLRSTPPPHVLKPRRSIVTFDPQAGAQQQVDTPDPGEGDGKGRDKPGRSAVIESALGTMAGIGLLAAAGIGYHHWYKYEALRKISNAFEAGWDPVLELASAGRIEASGGARKEGRIRRKEQSYIDKVINGEIRGEYLLLLGPKGVGKTTLIVEAMVKNLADGVAMMEAHEDPEVFRLRLGKALDFEYNEDSFAGLFQRKDPREAGPLLDIERALHKLEKVAIRYRRERGRPLVLIINNIHFVHDDPEGHSLLHMLQQRAESWAQAGVLTMVFNSDDFHPYRHLKKNASRMHVLSVRDLTPSETHACLSAARPEEFGPLDPAESLKVWDLVGGRLSFLSRLMGRKDMLQGAREMVEMEKGWLHHRLGLIPDLDDDVMDEQKVSSCSFLLFQEFARLAGAAEEVKDTALDTEEEIIKDAASPEDGDVNEAPPDNFEEVLTELQDPRVDYRRAREIMTRPDYISDLDHHNIINVDVNFHVRPDSRLMLSVFREICAEEDFQDKLDNVRARVDEIESLHRTSELTAKGKENGDLGGFLRLRVGQLLAEHEEGEEEAQDAAPRLV